MGNTLRLGDIFRLNYNIQMLCVVTEILEDRYNCTVIDGLYDGVKSFLYKERVDSVVVVGNVFEKEKKDD